MTSIRRLLGLFVTISLMAFALPAAADKVYQLQMSSNPAPLTAGASGLVTMQLNNIATDAGNSNVGSFKLNAPTGFTITSVYGLAVGAPPTSVAVGGGYTATIKNNGSSVWVSNIQVPLKPFGAPLVLSNMQVSVTCSPDTSGTWTMTNVWNGQNFSGQTFLLNVPTYSNYYPNYPSVVTTSVTGGGCAMSITAPSSALVGTSFTATVNLLGGAGGAAVTLTSDNCTVNTATPVIASGMVAQFSLTAPATSPANHNCALNATAPGYAPAPTVNVYIGTLGCNVATNPVFPPVPGTPGYFANLPAGVDDPTDPGFAAGYRVKDDKADPCNFTNYTFTNNILGSGNTTDTAGNTIPPNAAAVVWDLSETPNAVFAYMLTFKPEYVDAATGYPIKKTKFCILNPSTPTDCTIAANQANLKACIGTALSSTSIPGADPACIMQETWATVDQSLCPLWSGGGDPPACVRATDLLLDGRDPPIIRP